MLKSGMLVALALMNLHDPAANFDALWQRISPKNFRCALAASSPNFSQFKFKQWQDHGKDPDVELARERVAYSEYRAKFKRVVKELPGQLERPIKSFRQQFPDLRVPIAITIVQSLGEMDGGIRILNGQRRPLFGADAIARFHNSLTMPMEAPFLHHEFFHA